MKKLLTIILILSTSALFAQTFYISPSGNDAANGSIGTPWKTLSKATATVTLQSNGANWLRLTSL